MLLIWGIISKEGGRGGGEGGEKANFFDSVNTYIFPFKEKIFQNNTSNRLCSLV